MRSTARAVVAAAEAKRPLFVVENGIEFTRWALYSQWCSCLATPGYTLAENVLNAADPGVPQHLRRLFVGGVHKSVGTTPVVVLQGRSPHTPASAILAPDDACDWSPIRRPGRAAAPIHRWENGRREYGERFLMAYFGKERGGRSVSRPLGTVLTRDRYAVVNGDRMRMLTAREYLLVRGFPAGYRVPNVHKRAVRLIGNAVVPAVMKPVCEAVKSYLRNGQASSLRSSA